MRRLSICCGVAIATLAVVTTASEAQFRGQSRGMSTGSRMHMPGNGPRMGGFEGDSRRIGNRGPSKGASMGEGPGRGDDRRPPRHRRPPWIGPGIGTGVIIDTIDPVVANPSPPPPRSNSRSAPPPVQRAGINLPPNNEQRFVKDQVLLEFAANHSRQGIAQLLRRHGLVQLEAHIFSLTNSTFVRARIINRRPVRTVLLGLGRETAVQTGQPEYIYGATQQSAAGERGSGPAATIPGRSDVTPKATPVVAAAGALPAAGDPAQYALAKLRLTEAHTLANGDKVLVAVIDSGIDLGHPELQGVVAGSFDALGKAEKPHRHGTAIAGAIAAHARLMGAAPAARLLAIRAFSSTGIDAEATTTAILKGIEYASAQNARVINMSFAGPADPAMSRLLARAHDKGVVLVAASGNLGPNSPPQYPAADPNVIAVSATDADDKIFRAASIGQHIALTAPGVDILLPVPNRDYTIFSGTSFSAAYVSGVAALMLQRAPDLKPNAVRDILERTAKDLGARGKDKLYGAGMVDAYQAIVAVQSKTAGGPQ
ncbi:MAG TPA: S8 family serine peptidase [Alphaproteobacteria bacterium]